MFGFVSLFLKVIFFFRKNTEIKIKKKVEDMEESFIQMEKIDTILSRKISNFKE